MHQQNIYFDVSPWELKESTLTDAALPLAQTLFSLANGYIGTRATLEEYRCDHALSQDGTYLNGVYIREPIYYDEVAHAFASHNNKMVQVPDAKTLRIFVDGEAFEPSESDVVSHERTMNFKLGATIRRTVWALNDSRQLEVCTTQLASLEQKHLLVASTEIRLIGGSGNITVQSLMGTGHLQGRDKDAIDPRAGHIDIAESLSQELSYEKYDILASCHAVAGSGFLVHSAVAHDVSHGKAEPVSATSLDDGTQALSFTATLADGEVFTLTKYIMYHDTRVMDAQALHDEALKDLDDAKSNGIAYYRSKQEEQLDVFWQEADITINGDDALQQGIRFNMFQVYMSSGRDGKSSIGAKGLSGPGYDGHYFWDTEMYVVPFFIYTAPELARSLLEYRFSILDAARQRAREMSYPTGALYAWRTIGGEECSSYFPAGTAQYHINGAIAYAVLQYLQATDDWDFMCRYGLEMLCEMARVWVQVGHFSDAQDGEFCIHTVTGPDEYTALVDNNFYTNAIAKMHLEGTIGVLAHMRDEMKEVYDSIISQLDIKDDEIALWDKAAKNMRLPYNERLGIYAQDDTFLHKKLWDFDNVPKDKYPLLLHFHPLVIYRHQVLKQGDVVQTMALLGHQFDADIRRASLDYYEPLTTHDSTLSSCIHSIESARAGLHDKAYAFFEDNARMDIDNYHHNTEYGLHMACMAGSWMSIVFGFAGLEVFDGQLHFAPTLPAKWNTMNFSMRFKGRKIVVAVDKTSVTYTLTHGDTIVIIHEGQDVTLHASQPHVINHTLPDGEKSYA